MAFYKFLFLKDVTVCVCVCVYVSQVPAKASNKKLNP